MAILLIVIGWILFFETLILLLSQESSKRPFTHILVLGANGDAQSTINIDRARKALQAKEKYPEAKLVVSGNEKERGEVSALLANLGDHSKNAEVEELSTTTWENLENSRAILPPDSHTLIVTSDFHTARAVATAKMLGIAASPDSSASVPVDRKVAWWTRERAAVAIFLMGFLLLVGRRYFRR